MWIICICISLGGGATKKFKRLTVYIIMVEVRRRQHETVGAMLRRFTRKVQGSGILINARKNRFYAAAPSRRAVRLAALRRLGRARERMRLEKLGKAELK